MGAGLDVGGEDPLLGAGAGVEVRPRLWDGCRKLG